MKEATVSKVFALILAKQAISKKIDRLLGNGKERAPRIIPVEAGKRSAVSKATHKRLKLHGRYLGAIRPLTKMQRKAISKIRADKGYIKAIAKAKALARA